MNDLETLVRESLRARAGEPGPRAMPPGTLRRVHRREAGFGVGVLSLVAIAVVAAAALLRSLPLGDGQDTTAPPSGGFVGPSHPLEALPEGWPRIRVGDPREAYISPADSDDVAGQKEVIVSGTVEGSDFSFVGFTAARRGLEYEGSCLDFAGPASAPGREATSGGVQTVCAEVVPTRSDLELIGFGNGDRPDLEANYGFVSERVARLVVVLDDGSVVEVPILRGLDGWDVRVFLFFPPQGQGGLLVAYDADGRALARAPLCENTGVSGGCRGFEQLVPVVGSAS